MSCGESIKMDSCVGVSLAQFKHNRLQLPQALLQMLINFRTNPRLLTGKSSEQSDSLNLVCAKYFLIT